MDYLLYLYPQFEYQFKIDYSSGHNAKRIDGLSTYNINLGWGGKERKMRDSILSEDDIIGQIIHKQVLKVENLQSMVFTQNNIPSIFIQMLR